MKNFSRIINLLSLNYDRDHADEYRPRILVINILSVFIVLMIPVVSLFSFVEASSYQSTLLFLAGTVSVYFFNILLFKKTYNYHVFAIGYLAGTLIIGSVFFFFMIHENWIVFWTLVYPMLAIYLLGQKRGNYFTVFLLVFYLYVLFYMLGPDAYKVDFPLIYKVHLLVIFGFLWLLGNIYNWYLDQSLDKVREAHSVILKENEKKERFLTQLSHQIRTPLNDIVAFENLLKKTRIAEEDREMFEMILVSTTDLIQVVESISETGAFTTPVKQVSNQPFRLGEVFGQMEELTDRQYKEKLRVMFPEDAGDLTLIGDRIIFKQVLMNVLEGIFRNAQDIPHKAVIATKQKEEKEKILLTIQFQCDREVFNRQHFKHLTFLADQGVRVLSDPEDFQYINLLLARNLCRQMGGTLELNDFKEGSPCLHIVLPFGKTSKARREAASPAMTEIPSPGGKKLSDATVLLAEDNPINQKIVKLSLQRYVKQIDIAQDGKEALDLYGSTRYDFILMDIQMPRMDGITVTRKIREIEASTNTHTPIIAITANAMLGDRETCISSGMDEYLSKPFQIQTLIDIMKDLLH